MWDPLTAERLSLENKLGVLHPLAILEEIARERGWDSDVPLGSPDERWARGMTERFGGTNHLHSALLALKGDRDAIEARVWRGEVGVILPFIEDQRALLVRHLGRRFPLPWQPDKGKVISDPRKLQIGQIEYLLRNMTVDRGLRRKVRMLCKMRNDLAHLVPLTEVQISMLDPLAEDLERLCR